MTAAISGVPRLDEIRRRTLAGETSAQIGAAVGLEPGSVRRIRREKLGITRYRSLHLTPEQGSAIEAKIVEGLPLSAIAAEFAVSQAAVWRRARPLKDRIRTDLALVGDRASMAVRAGWRRRRSSICASG